jgi:feruloyl-CoA synthase
MAVPFARALYETVADDIELVVTRSPLGDRKTTLFADLPAHRRRRRRRCRAAQRWPPKRLPNSCSPPFERKSARRVINTHRMLCSNQAMLASGFAFVADEPPVVVDWSALEPYLRQQHNFNMVLTNGGSLYIDDGNPTPPGVPKTAKNSRDRADIYFNVPKGYEALIAHLPRR